MKAAEVQKLNIELKKYDAGYLKKPKEHMFICIVVVEVQIIILNNIPSAPT